MRLPVLVSLGCLGLLCAAGCPSTVGERNAFLTLTEQFGTFEGQDEDQGGGAGTAGEGEFRTTLNLTLANNNPDAELNVSFVAWVNVSSIRSAEQQDILLSNGYVQLTREIRLGTVFALPPGTFVYNGPGVAGATTFLLTRAQGAADGDTAGTVTSVPEVIPLVTPDVILVFEEPPVSCDSVAFRWTSDNENFLSEFVGGGLGLFQGATGQAGIKTLAQVNVYQCDPLRPGLFLKIGGGARETNEYFEGEDIRFDFNTTPDALGNFAIVTIGATTGTGGQTP